MKKIAIVCALEAELEKIKNQLENLNEIKLPAGVYYSGKINDVEVIGCVCSIGKVNASIKTQALISHFNPTHIINTGIAGSVSDKAKHLSVVVGDKVFYHDFDLNLFKKYYPYVDLFKCDKAMIEGFVKANSSHNLTIGNIATGDEFVESSEKKKVIASTHNAICCEMEGASIAHTALVNNLPCLVIRSISDMADDNADFDYGKFEKIAADIASTMVINYIESL